MELISYLGISLLINILLFIPAFLWKTDKLTDFSYSLSFIILTLVAFVFSPQTIVSLILTIMVLIWSIRLGVFLFIRIKNQKKDRRFDGVRESFFLFLKFWVLQAVAVWIILIPTLYGLNATILKLSPIGIIIWIVGLLVESIADAQKFAFKQNKKNKHKFIQTGLWKYSRHPNYFGEILCWIGIFIAVSPTLTFVPLIIASLSPIFITTLLLFGTGIPMLEKHAEKKWGHTTSYKNYKHKTSILIPWLRK